MRSVAFLCADVGRLFRKRFDHVARQFGMTGPQWRMLSMIARTPGSRQATLAAELEVEAITAARMLDRLQAAGLVTRDSDPADRRAWCLRLTPTAEPLMDQLVTHAAPIFADALHGFSAEEAATLLALLERVRANLSEHAVATP